MFFWWNLESLQDFRVPQNPYLTHSTLSLEHRHLSVCNSLSYVLSHDLTAPTKHDLNESSSHSWHGVFLRRFLLVHPQDQSARSAKPFKKQTHTCRHINSAVLRDRCNHIKSEGFIITVQSEGLLVQWVYNNVQSSLVCPVDYGHSVRSSL